MIDEGEIKGNQEGNNKKERKKRSSRDATYGQEVAGDEVVGAILFENVVEDVLDADRRVLITAIDDNTRQER